MELSYIQDLNELIKDIKKYNKSLMPMYFTRMGYLTKFEEPC